MVYLSRTVFSVRFRSVPRFFEGFFVRGELFFDGVWRVLLFVEVCTDF